MAVNLESTIVEDRTQKDGRRWIREHHRDQYGVIHPVVYLAELEDNVAAIMAARIASLIERITQREIEYIATELPPNPTLRYATIAQLGAEIRERYRAATGLEAGRIAVWLLARTDAQLRTAFGITQAELTNNVKPRLQLAADKYNAAISVVGE